MFKKLRAKIKHKNNKPNRRRSNLSYILILSLFVSPLLNFINLASVRAAGCPDVKLIFARGSGEKQDIDQSFMAINAALGSKMQKTNLKYQSEDLEYPAPAVGLKNLHSLLVTLGAAVSGGESYEFGRSVDLGVSRLVNEVNSNICPDTKYVLGGYSQGAILLDKALKKIDPSRVLYAATFGDPKIYLPEGKGLHPDACKGKNLSEYRMYVPECHSYQGILGGYIPYRSESLVGKVGTWCDSHDILCSRRFSIDNHSAYVRDNLYEDASRVMFAKISQHFGLGTSSISPHDTAILIDSTSSMTSLIGSYKKEALRLAEQTLNSGGRVALYEYRDLVDASPFVEHCSFETCKTTENFAKELESIKADGGGDARESLLSASLKVMLPAHKWRVGATKSLVVLTDAGFHNPDLDGTTLEQVVATSKEIDPVNFYIITKSYNVMTYQQLADRTDGEVVTELDKLDLLTDRIMDRYDSLPRVEESDEDLVLPTLSILEAGLNDETSARVVYTSDAPKAMVFLNDTFLGITDQKELTITDLDAKYQNELTLVPLTDSLRGEPVSIQLSNSEPLYNDENNVASTPEPASAPAASSAAPATPAALPKAPNTGQPKRSALKNAQ